MKQISLFPKQVRKGMRVTSFFALVITALIVVFTSAAAIGPVNFDTGGYTMSSYGGAPQDGTCDATGGVATTNGGLTLEMTGNCWKKIDLGYNVTTNTILEFDFQSTSEAEIQGIGFDTDDTINNPQSLILQVFGTQSYGSIVDTYPGAGNAVGDVVHYVIPVGNYYTGNFTSMTFINDDDVAPVGNSAFSNINVYEGTPPPPPMLTVDSNGTPVTAEVVPYGGTQDSGPATIAIEDGGLTLHIVGNAWKKVEVPYTITSDTVLEFDFSSSAEGEIHGVGLDNDDTIDNPIQIYQFYGTQAYGIATSPTYDPGSNPEPAVVHYTISLGTLAGNSYTHLTFTNDHDVATPTGESIFSNVSIHELAPTPTSTFDLWAVAGATDLPGMFAVPVWGYNTSNSPVGLPGGPTLTVTQGDEVTINLHNELGETTALLIQGQNMIPDLTGVGSGGMTSYTFTANKPGTFLYEAGLLPNTQHQVAMGLYGALVVYPADAPGQAYTDASTAFDTEQVLVLSELDPALNTSGDPALFDMRQYRPQYYLINGKPYPATDSVNVNANETLLLRYVNAGLQAHSMSALGFSQTIIAQDGNQNANGRTVVAETIATGQTLDTLASVPNATDGTQYPLYDASLFLRNNTGNGTYAGLGGMLTMITIGTGTTPPLPDTAGPVVQMPGLDPSTINGFSDVTVSATLNDISTGNSNIAVAEFFIDYVGPDGTGHTMTATDSEFNSPSEDAFGTILAANIMELTSGLHVIYVHGQDAFDNWGSFAAMPFEYSANMNDSLHFSTAGTVNPGPGGTSGDAGDVYEWDGLTSAYAIASNLPDGVNVDGLEYVSDTDFYVSFDGEVDLGFGPIADEDVVHFDGTTWSMTFDGSLAGLNEAVNLDALSYDGALLYFSMGDVTYTDGVDTFTIHGADIYLWDGSSITLVVDASLMGFSDHNVDGLVFNSLTDFYVSYSKTSTPVAGLGTVQDEDVIHYDGTAWSIYFDGTANGLTSNDVNANSYEADAFDIP